MITNPGSFRRELDPHGDEGTQHGPFDRFKKRTDRLPHLRNLTHYLNNRHILSFDEMIGATVVELQAGEAPFSELAQNLYQAETVYTVDELADACASISQYGNIPKDRVINVELRDFFQTTMKELGIHPKLITLTCYQPNSQYTLTDLIQLVAKSTQNVTLLITCAEEERSANEFYQARALLLSHKIEGEVRYSEEWIDVNQKPYSPADKYVMVVDL